MPSALEGGILDEPVVFSEPVLAAAVLFIFQFSLNYSKHRLNFAPLNSLR